MDSTGGNDEEYKTSLIVLPSYSENSDSDGVTGKDYCSCPLREFCFINLKLKENLRTRRCPILFLFVICILLITLSSFFHICHSIEGVKVEVVFIVTSFSICHLNCRARGQGRDCGNANEQGRKLPLIAS